MFKRDQLRSGSIAAFQCRLPGSNKPAVAVDRKLLQSAFKRVETFIITVRSTGCVRANSQAVHQVPKINAERLLSDRNRCSQATALSGIGL